MSYPPDEMSSIRDPAEAFMMDPSLLLTVPGVTALADPAVAQHVVVSREFVSALAERQDERLAPFAGRSALSGFLEEWREPLLSMVSQLEQFSSYSIDVVPPEIEEVRRGILELPTPAAEILADEWVYLTTRSWLAAKRKWLLDKLKQAGADVREYKGRVVHELIAEVVKESKIPETFTPEFIAKVGAKWIVYGAGVGGVAVGGVVIAGPGGAAAGAPASRLIRPLIRGFDP